MSKVHVTGSSSRVHSGVAVAVSAALWGGHAFAAEPTRTSLELEEVIVTGSLISGTPEDAALPVETISYEELLDMGKPTNLELVKMMSEVGQVAGEADRYNSFPIGAATVNLRNLGQKFTTVIFNGRRFPEQYSPVTGRFNNIAWIPNAAINSVEVLKGGGAVTYGADAVAGVVNYKTRRTLDGLEASVDYRYIDDSDGDYGADISWGAQLERGNLMVVGSYAHQSSIALWDREWARQPYMMNNNGFAWAAGNNPGTYAFQTGAASNTNITPISPTNFYTGERQMGPTGLVRDPMCSEFSNSFAGWSGTPSPLCYFNTTQFENAVEEMDTTSLYVEFNYELTDWLEYSSEYLLFAQRLPDIAMHPSDAPLAVPMTALGTPQLGGGTLAYYVPGQNPGMAPWLNSFLDSDGTTSFTPAQINSILTTGRGILPLGTWRPFAISGNPLYGRYDPQENSTDFYRTTQAFGGDIGESGLRWDVALTYNYIKDRREARDMLIDRLQAALNGFGGPNCTGTVAGQNGCEWFNPFPSAFSHNFYTGEANPSYIPGLENDIDMIEWLYVPIWLQRDYKFFVADATLSGKTGWELPGGPVAVAVGAQYRLTEEETSLSDEANRGINPCATLGATNCTTRSGALAFTRNSTVLGATLETDREFPVYAAFAEMQFPLLDTVTLQVAGRYEKFLSDQSDRDNDVFVPSAAIRWQATDWMAIRGAWGQTFSQVNPPAPQAPTQSTSGSIARFGGFGGTGSQYQQFDYPNLDVQPMEGEYLNVGFIFNAGGFYGSVDFYDVSIGDYARTMSDDDVVAGLVMPGENTIDSLIDCSSPLLSQNQSLLDGRPFVELSGPCVQGTSRLNTVPVNAGDAGGLTNGRINYFGGTAETNAGTLSSRGIDVSMSYTFEDVFGGELRPFVDGSYILEWELDDFVVAGSTLAEGYDGVGFVNGTSTGRIGQAVPEWRATFGLNYRWDIHNINIAAHFIPGITDEDTVKYGTSSLATNANIGDQNGFATSAACATSQGITSPPVPAGAGSADYGTGANSRPGTRGYCQGQVAALLAGKQIDDYLTIDLNYRVNLPAETTLLFSIYNLLDEDPAFARTAVSYMSGFGNPLGRNYKMTLSKRF